jgi:hypothetical protein
MVPEQLRRGEHMHYADSDKGKRRRETIRVVDPDQDSGARTLRISVEKCTFKLFLKKFNHQKRYKIALTTV